MMFKRLSSSGPAFLLTLRRHLLRDRVFLHAVEKSVPYPRRTVGQSCLEPELRAQKTTASSATMSSGSRRSRPISSSSPTLHRDCGG